MRLPSLLVVPAAIGLSATSAHAARVINFNSLPVGLAVSEQIEGVSISALNPYNGVPDEAVVFDFNNDRFVDSGQSGPPWSMGNIDLDTNLGNGLVVGGARRSEGIPFETRRPAGDLLFRFDAPLTSFGFTMVDVEGPEEFVTDTGFFVEFGSGDAIIDTFDFADLVTPGTMLYDPDIQFGNRSANRIAPITAAMLGVESFDFVEISIGGSAVVAQITIDDTGNAAAIPTPTAAAGGLALLGLALNRRRPR